MKQHILVKQMLLKRKHMRIIRKEVSKMERNLHIHCPEDVDRSLFARLFSSLVVGDDLDDLIFNGEEWYKSER